MRLSVVHLLGGTAFGFVLANNGAADFDSNFRMFTFAEFHLFGLGMVSVGLSALMLYVLRRRAAQGGLAGRIRWSARPIHRGSIIGSLLFGVGWALSGACPGTALVQVGLGHWIALATVAGIFAGIGLHDLVNRRALRWPVSSCD